MKTNNKNEIIFPINKKLGQNFIKDKDYLRKIIKLSNLRDNSMIIEIGAGYGEMTGIIREELKDGKIKSIEKDKFLFNFNKKKEMGVEFIHDDALKIDWEIITSERDLYSSVVVLGNLPFNISNSLIIDLLMKKELFDEFIFLIQKEVGERWAAYEKEKYAKKRGSNSAFIKYHCDIKILIDKVPREFFYPIPSVDGMLIKLIVKKEVKNDRKKMFLFLKELFSFRRKAILKRIISKYKDKDKEIKDFFAKRKIKEKIRIQEMSLEDVVRLFSILKQPELNDQ